MRRLRLSPLARKHRRTVQNVAAGIDEASSCFGHDSHFMPNLRIERPSARHSFARPFASLISPIASLPSIQP